MNTKHTWQQVEKLKSEDRFAHAGSLAFILGHTNDYGCHYGMRSSCNQAADTFRNAWFSAERDYRQAIVRWVRENKVREND